MCICPKFKHILLLTATATTVLEDSGRSGPTVLAGDRVGHEQESP